MTKEKITLPPVDSLIKFNDEHNERHICYVRITGFYEIREDCGGGRGFHYKMLDGTGSGSCPESFVKNFKKFKSIEEMNNDIEKGNKHVF